MDDASGLSTLTHGLLDAEDERLGSAGEVDRDIDESVLPGVGEQERSLWAGLAAGGGAFTFVVLVLMNSLDQLEAAGMAVLGPDIGKSLGVSEGVIVFVTSASAAFVVLGVVPMAWLADRVRRSPLVGICGLVFSAMAALSGAAVNAFMLFWTRFGVGVSQAHTIPVHSAILADAYPIGIRGRMASFNGTVGRIAGAASPVLVGGIAALFGGAAEGGWRWSFILLAIPVAAVSLLAFKMKEPVRGRWERESVIGGAPAADVEVPISIEMAFARLNQIKTLRTLALAFAAIGFQLFPMVSLTNFFLRDNYGLDAFHRGLVASCGGALVIFVLPFTGKRFDALYRVSPPRAMRILALLILPAALLTPLQFNMPNAVAFTVVMAPGTVLTATAFAMVAPIVQGVIPYRLRSLGIAYAAIYIFLFGAVGGSLIGSALASSLGDGPAIMICAIPSAVVATLLLLRGSWSIDADLQMIVADIRDEQAERERQLADPETIPALALSDIDFSYGNVQVLFGVDLQVARGETLALLGTNGAGKSTILRVVAGLGTPSAGAVRLNGRTITFTSPEQRIAMGIQLLPGGKGVFPSLSVAENLEVASYVLDRPVRAARVERVWELFPDLRAHAKQGAGTLSGGQQQQLALARVLLHDPELLLIDELSLGLAPAVVEDLLGVIERLKGSGQTMVIVEQSLNIALQVADRAVFLEKGAVRFDGDARELAARDDLARAVFLGGR
ncbi:MAG TPA: MFS transporter [Acidimicrobiales bacterium]|jgi:ABC-type branched-subunit amino acid transport system ATPase component/predicted MFS family arabinose efflux permease|nr:MFS transporter [Acidimicrobiales bacterium]